MSCFVDKDRAIALIRENIIRKMLLSCAFTKISPAKFSRYTVIYRVLTNIVNVWDLCLLIKYMQACLVRSFKADVFTCPNCRHPLGKEYEMDINQQLQDILLDLFPGYDGGR